MIYNNNLKKLRKANELIKKYLATEIRYNCNQWESCFIMNPFKITDKSSIHYNVSLSCVLDFNNKFKIDYIIRKVNYNHMLINLQKLKIKNTNTFFEISKYLKCDNYNCIRYFNTKTIMQIYRLILLCEFYDVDIDEYCDKK